MMLNENNFFVYYWDDFPMNEVCVGQNIYWTIKEISIVPGGFEPPSQAPKA